MKSASAVAANRRDEKKYERAAIRINRMRIAARPAIARPTLVVLLRG
jgi:hypothetical protein